MVGVLIRMKLTVLRRTATGPKASWTIIGGLLGVAAALGTIGLATVRVTSLDTVRDLLATVFAIWAFGWMLGPAWTGEPVLRPEHFALQPIRKRQLAIGLLATAFVAITTAVTLLAFVALVVFAARLGTVPVIVSIPGVLLQLILVVLLSRLAARMFGALSRSRIGAAVSGVITALLLVVASAGWLLVVVLNSVLAHGFSTAFAIVVQALPSGWALVAVDASARHDWPMTVLPLLGLLVLVTLLVLAWSRLLGPARLAGAVVRGGADRRAGQGAVRAVLLRELRSWRRSPVRVQAVVIAVAFAVLAVLLPVPFGSAALLPFVGALTALMGAATSANLYGQDGTGLWLTLSVPGSERADVTGRQLGWLIVFGPAAIVLTALGTFTSGQAQLWPWALAITVALLGAGTGLVPLVGIGQLAPGPDPHRNKNSPLEHGDQTGGAFVMLLLALLLAVPTLIVLVIGARLGSQEVLAGATAVGVITGFCAYAQLGRLAHRRLAARGPELLYLMRTGKEQEAQVAAGSSVIRAMPPHRRRLWWLCVGIGFIALVPQSLAPLAMKLSGHIAKVWFLALYLPESWQWPMIALMFVLAVLAFALALRLYLVQGRIVARRRELTAREVTA